MDKKFLLFLIVLLSLLPALSVHSSCRTDEVEKLAFDTLLKTSKDSSFWVKIHALEFLLQTGHQDIVCRQMEEDKQTITALPQKRIGYWRILFKTEQKAEVKEELINNLYAVYTNANAPDRVHAVEALAKLGYSLKNKGSISEEDSILNYYADWASVLPTSHSDTLDYDRIFTVLQSTQIEARKIMAYGISYMGLFPEAKWVQLVDFVLKEPLSSPVAVYLLSGAVNACPARDKYSNEMEEIHSRLIQLTGTALKANRYEALIALGKLSVLADTLLYQDVLLNDGDWGTFNVQEITDIRSAAAFALLHTKAESKAESKAEASQLTWADWVVIALFILSMLLIGYLSSKKNKTANDYVLGGKDMNPVMIGISLFATLLSTLSYLAYPGEMIKYGPVVFTGLAAFPVATWIVGKFLIPRFMQMNVTSAYEILEIKLGRGTRMLGTIYFLSLRFLWMSTIIYATVDTALMPIFNFPQEWVPLISIVLVLVTVVYTTMGGLKAVVMTDVIQTVVMFLGVILTIGIILYKLGSTDIFFTPELYSHWETMDWNISMTKRMTIGNIFIMTLVWQVATSGSDQMAIQRYLATKDAKTASRSYGISLFTSGFIQLLLALVALAVMAYFTEFPEMMKKGTTLFDDADTLFPRFILIGLPPGVTGLIAAAIMAAAMSSLSSGLNSSSTVIQQDVLSRRKMQQKSGNTELRQIKIISAGLGIAVSCASFLVMYVTGNLLDVVIKVVNLVVAPLFVLFFMALFVPFATNRGTICGGLFSLFSAILIAFFSVFGISVLWIMPASLITGILVGALCSFMDRLLFTSKV